MKSFSGGKYISGHKESPKHLCVIKRLSGGYKLSSHVVQLLLRHKNVTKTRNTSSRRAMYIYTYIFQSTSP